MQLKVVALSQDPKLRLSDHAIFNLPFIYLALLWRYRLLLILLPHFKTRYTQNCPLKTACLRLPMCRVSSTHPPSRQPIYEVLHGSTDSWVANLLKSVVLLCCFFFSFYIFFSCCVFLFFLYFLFLSLYFLFVVKNISMLCCIFNMCSYIIKLINIPWSLMFNFNLVA